VSGGDHRWFKRSTGKKRPATRDIHIIIIITIIIIIIIIIITIIINFKVLIYRFYKIFKLNFQCAVHLTTLPFDAKPDLVRNVHSTVIYISYYHFVFSLKMVLIAETCC
jgi:hypothetical protein